MEGYQQSHRYMRPPPPPPPPPAADQYHQHNPYVQEQKQPRPPVPPQGHQWYSNQFQYQPPPSHSPSPPLPPPPPTNSQWAPHPPSSPYPAPPPPPYSAHYLHQINQYTLPPPPPPPPQVAQSYYQANQDWGNQNRGHHHQSWDYTAHNNVQDWAARAKEWANARAAMENQQMQSQFPSVGRSEEQTRINDQYPQSADFHYSETQQQPIPISSYQQIQLPAAAIHQPPVAYQQENASVSSGLSSYGSDVHLSYYGRDGASTGEVNVRFPLQENSHCSPTVHPQEVPSSYSSVTGKEENVDQKENVYRSLPVPISSASKEQAFAYGNQATNPPLDRSDQPLDFEPMFNHDHDLHMHSSYATHHESAATVRGIDPAAAVPSVNSWTSPIAPSVVYPSIPPVLPAVPQHDPSIAMASVPGPTAPQFGRFPGQSLPPTIPFARDFGIGAGTTLHPTTAFPGDAYGVSGASEHPKKAPVPNWLKEEIIKNKATIAKSSLGNHKEETQSIEEEGVGKLLGKTDQADSKSIDSSKSTEEEYDDDDEDYVEAARTAAINQEIKRILTEVLLKVTDELFDEIATKVLSEDDLSVEGNDNTVTPNRKVSPPPRAITTPRASAKVLAPFKAKESETRGSSEKSTSSSPGDVLGLANYASDDEIQSSSMPNSRNNVGQQSTVNKLSEYVWDASENGSHVKPEEQNGAKTDSINDLNKTNSLVSKNNNSGAVSKLSENRVDKNAYSSSAISVKGDDNENRVDGGKLLDSNNGSKSNETLREKDRMKISANDNSQSSEMRMKPVKNDHHESKRSSSRKDGVKEVEIGRRADNKEDKIHRRHDERHSRKEKTDDRNGSGDRIRDGGAKPEEKRKESKSRKTSPDDVKEDRRDAERQHRASAKEGVDKKRDRSKEDDTSRHKLTNDSDGHKRRHSSSITNRGRNSRDDSISHVNDSNDGSSDDSKRKRHSRKRNSSSPSPVRSKTRQVTRSPHSKHSQGRHSPYSSLETARGRRSRSRSPVQRHR